MELKICPDGQNKGFGWKSGKQRERERKKEEKGERKVVLEGEKTRNEITGGDVEREREQKNMVRRGKQKMKLTEEKKRREK